MQQRQSSKHHVFVGFKPSSCLFICSGTCRCCNLRIFKLPRCNLPLLQPALLQPALLQTVIECLKQACTGELPPNVGGNGRNWVMDPKVCDAAVRFIKANQTENRVNLVGHTRMQRHGIAPSVDVPQAMVKPPE